MARCLNCGTHGLALCRSCERGEARTCIACGSGRTYQWYAGPVCQPCYQKSIGRPKRRRRSPANRRARQRAAKRNRPKFLRRAAAVRSSLKTVPCADCGKQYPAYVMDFDHLPGSAKRANVSRLRTQTAIRSEAEKCDVVCANCHRERTFRRIAARA